MRTQFEEADMDVQEIRSESDYRAALKSAASLMDAKAGSPDGDKLDVLATLIEAYEALHYPIEAPTPIEAIKFSMDQKGLQQADLQAILGSLGNAHELLNGTLQLTLPMIWRLHKDLGIPSNILIRPPEGEPAAA
jgi:HTH-type transcriptional regulator/antitoxin HigA